MCTLPFCIISQLKINLKKQITAHISSRAPVSVKGELIYGPLHLRCLMRPLTGIQLMCGSVIWQPWEAYTQAVTVKYFWRFRGTSVCITPAISWSACTTAFTRELAGSSHFWWHLARIHTPWDSGFVRPLSPNYISKGPALIIRLRFEATWWT